MDTMGLLDSLHGDCLSGGTFRGDHKERLLAAGVNAAIKPAVGAAPQLNSSPASTRSFPQ
jgi:hypothetical protein